MTMFFIDTHAHLYAKEFDQDRRAMLQRAKDQAVIHSYLPNVDLDSIEPMLALEAEYPDQCTAMMGLHPCSVEDDWKAVLRKIEAWLGKRNFVAIGEIGLDYYWSKIHIKEQQEALLLQACWAQELQLPIILHARDSIDDLIGLIRQAQELGPLQGIFHCFTGDAQQAKTITEELGFFLGIGGVLTYPKANLAAALVDIPLDKMVLETDAPYLPPTPHRGKRNESSYVPLVAQALAKAKNLPLEQIAQMTTANAHRLFGQPQVQGKKS
jgi:TatD DNase family protein